MLFILFLDLHPALISVQAIHFLSITVTLSTSANHWAGSNSV